MKRKTYLIIFASVILILLAGSCKKTYFHIAEEINDNAESRFTLKESYYRMGKSIALTAGRFEITPGDSIVLYIEGQGRVQVVGKGDAVGLDFAQTMRFYIGLPIRLSVQKYDTRYKAICEITGSLNYGPGENLFTCQSGWVVIDSLKGDDFFGRFSGEYLNTSNKSLTVKGPFKAGLKQ